MQTTHKLFFFLISFLYTQQIFACGCIDKTSIKEDIKYAKLIIKGKILKKEIITTYDTDTLDIRYYYKQLKNKNKYQSYKDYKESVWGRQLLEYTIERIKSYKGDNTSNHIKVRTGFGRGDCGYKFEIDKIYLIFAVNAQSLTFLNKPQYPKWEKIKNVYETNFCMRTKLFSDATNELIKLKPNITITPPSSDDNH